MSIKRNRNRITLKDTVTIEDAEALYAILLKLKKPKVDLRECTHMHSAIYQLLMLTKVEILHPPEDENFAAWFRQAPFNFPSPVN